MTLRVDEHSHLGELVLSGELDFAQAGRVVDEARIGLADAAVRQLVVDMRDVTFIDSTGIGELINVRRMAGAAGRPVTLRNVGPGTAGVLKMAAVDQVFENEPSP